MTREEICHEIDCRCPSNIPLDQYRYWVLQLLCTLGVAEMPNTEVEVLCTPVTFLRVFIRYEFNDAGVLINTTAFYATGAPYLGDIDDLVPCPGEGIGSSCENPIFNKDCCLTPLEPTDVCKAAIAIGSLTENQLIVVPGVTPCDPVIPGAYVVTVAAEIDGSAFPIPSYTFDPGIAPWRLLPAQVEAGLRELFRLNGISCDLEVVYFNFAGDSLTIRIRFSCPDVLVHFSGTGITEISATTAPEDFPYTAHYKVQKFIDCAGAVSATTVVIDDAGNVITDPVEGLTPCLPEEETIVPIESCDNYVLDGIALNRVYRPIVAGDALPFFTDTTGTCPDFDMSQFVGVHGGTYIGQGVGVDTEPSMAAMYVEFDVDIPACGPEVILRGEIDYIGKTAVDSDGGGSPNYDLSFFFRIGDTSVNVTEAILGEIGVPYCAVTSVMKSARPFETLQTISGRLVLSGGVGSPTGKVKLVIIAQDFGALDVTQYVDFRLYVEQVCARETCPAKEVVPVKHCGPIETVEKCQVYPGAFEELCGTFKSDSTDFTQEYAITVPGATITGISMTVGGVDRTFTLNGPGMDVTLFTESQLLELLQALAAEAGWYGVRFYITSFSNTTDTGGVIDFVVKITHKDTADVTALTLEGGVTQSSSTDVTSDVTEDIYVIKQYFFNCDGDFDHIEYYDGVTNEVLSQQFVEDTVPCVVAAAVPAPTPPLLNFIETPYTIVDGAAAVDILGISLTRKRFWVQNLDTDPVWISLTGTAAPDTGQKIEGGETFVSDGWIVGGVVTAYQNSGHDALILVTEGVGSGYIPLLTLTETAYSLGDAAAEYVLAPNGSRKIFWIQNISGEDVWLSLTGVAAPNTGQYLGAGDRFISDGWSCVSAISAYQSSGAPITILITEGM